MNNFTKKSAATSSVLTQWIGEDVAVRRTFPPVMQLDGTGLPVLGAMHDTRISGIGMGAVATADKVRGLDVVADRDFDVQGIPPRWWPSRC